MPLATTDDLAGILGRELTDAEDAQAEAAIRLASAMVRAELPDVALADGDNVVAKVPGTWDRDLRLPKRQVTAVHAVSINGSELDDESGWTWLGGDSIRRGAWFLESADPSADVVGGATAGPVFHWGGPHAVVEVTYDYAAVVPPAVWATVVQVAKRLFLNPAGVRQESLGGYAVTYDNGDGSASLNAAERDMLRKYRTRAR